MVRANAGDCLMVTLRNKLPAAGLPAHTGDVPLPADAPFPAGNRVSMHPALLDVEVGRADGSAVGYNLDSTIGPGQTIQYFWYVPPKLDGASVNLVDFGDRRGNRHHGLFAGLLVEPTGSTWTDPGGNPLTTGTTAVISWTDATGAKKSFREFALEWQDGLNLRKPDGSAVPPSSAVDDPYESGNRGINYRNERFDPRLGSSPDPADVFSSAVHGDPATPVLQTYAGDPVRIRLLQGGDRGRVHSVAISGHGWADEPSDPTSRVVNVSGRLMPNEGRTLTLIGGAGSVGKNPGDYLIRDVLLPNQVNAGLWALLRVNATVQPGLKPL